MEHLDLNAIAELKDVMGEEFSILVETYLRDSAERLQQLKLALDENDAEGFGRTAHSFKGSCANVGARLLAEYCLTAEKMGRAGIIQDGAEIYQKIDTEFKAVDLTLRAYL